MEKDCNNIGSTAIGSNHSMSAVKDLLVLYPESPYYQEHHCMVFLSMPIECIILIACLHNQLNDLCKPDKDIPDTLAYMRKHVLENNLTV